MTPPLFRLSGIDCAFEGRKILAGVNLALFPGDRLALVGPNGAGKTTLLHVLVGLRAIDRGRIEAFGQVRSQESDFREVRAKAGLLFQDADDQLFCPTVLEDVAFGPLNLGKSREEARHIAHEVLASLGLSSFAGRITHRLSGGEKRLVALATVLAMEPLVLLLDEPTNALDAETAERMTLLLLGLPQAMVIISHDRLFLQRLANRAVHLSHGHLHEVEIHAHEHVHSHLHIHAPELTEHRH